LAEEDDLALVEKIRCPVMMLNAAEDPVQQGPDGAYHNILKAKSFGGECVFKVFGKAHHGWTTRGDISNPDIKAALSEFMEITSAFLLKHLQ
jgi:dienelactone hydrolase